MLKICDGHAKVKCTTGDKTASDTFSRVQSLCNACAPLLLLLLSGHPAWRDGMPTVPRCLHWHPSPQHWHLEESPGEGDQSACRYMCDQQDQESGDNMSTLKQRWHLISRLRIMLLSSISFTSRWMDGIKWCKSGEGCLLLFCLW